jgi:hypothetical protein
VNKEKSAYRRKLATILVALYAFCVLAPHAALAFVRAGNAAHCFTESANAPHQHDHAAKSAHVHDDGTARSHDQAANSSADDDKAAQVACCGLFSVPALATEAPATLHAPILGEKIAAVPQSHLADHPPGRLIRPPIA